MTDYLVIRSLILILLDKVSRTRECYLGNIFLNLFFIHTNTGIDELKGLLLGIDNNPYLVLKVIRISVFSNHIKLFKLGDGIASV